MGATWASTWVATATAFYNNSGQFKAKHKRTQRETIFEYIDKIKDTRSLVSYLQKEKVLPNDDNLELKQLNGKKGDRLNEGYKFHLVGSNPSK